MPTSVMKSALAVACALSLSSAFAADALSRDEVKAAKDQISATYDADKEACDKLKDNAQDVCEQEARAKRKVAEAELDYKRTGKEADRVKAAEVKAEQEYAVAKERCDDLSGDRKDACQKEAKANEAKAKAELKGDVAAKR
jgi:hypothetical protein